jgi:predicted transcriptional regulator
LRPRDPEIPSLAFQILVIYVSICHVNRWNYKFVTRINSWFILCADVILILTEKVSGELEMLQRHLVILKQVVENEPIGILKLAEETKIPSHKVRYSLRVLEQEGLIRATAPGAVTTNQTISFLRELDSMIEDLSKKAEDLLEIKIKR